MSTSSIPISKTKIIVPHRRAEILTRPRLLEDMKGLLTNKLVLLAAPAGYGKTSLLIDLTQYVDLKVCWLSLDTLDRNPQRFIAYLIASLVECFPDVGEASKSLLNQLKSIKKDSETLLVTLTNELYERVEEDYLIILDDYHLLDDAPIISSLLNRFLQLVDENCHVLISSRTLPDLDDVTLMVAREQVAGLSHAELAFLPREVQALYAQNHRQHLSDEMANEIVTRTGGWITGMVLSNLSDMRVSGVDTFSYLGRQVLDHQPKHIRQFLLWTSLPEEFSADFCEHVLAPLYASNGPQNWLALMGWILEKNLFVLPLGEDGRWLRYHPLFREFLQKRLKAEHPESIKLILDGMINYYEQANEWEKAYDICKQMNDVNRLANVVEHAGTTMLQSALVTLEDWLRNFPPTFVLKRPGLISLLGTLHALRGNFQESSNLLDKAVAAYRRSHNMGGLTLALTRRANTLRLSGNYNKSLHDVEEALSLAESDSLHQSDYAEALRLKGINFFYLGESRRAVEALEHSLSIYSAVNDTIRIPQILMETGLAYRTIGDVESAKRAYLKALSFHKAENNIYRQAETLNNLGVLYRLTGEYELASDAFEKGLICARQSRNQRTECALLAGLGDLYGEVGEYYLASKALDQSEALAEQLPGSPIANYLIYARGNLELFQGNIEATSQILASHRSQAKSTQSLYERGLWNLLEGRLHLMYDEIQDAIICLENSKSAFVQGGRMFESLWSAVWLMAAYERASEYEKTREELQEILKGPAIHSHSFLIALLQASQFLIHLKNDTQNEVALRGLFEKAQKLKEKLPNTRRELRRHAQTLEVPDARLIVRAFGRPEIISGGQAVNMSDWRTQSVRDLFFYFVHKQTALTRERVGEVLWPEISDPQTLKKRFKNDIYRLRRAVGKDVIVFDEEFYRFNQTLDYEYDVETFEAYFKRAHTSNDMNEKIMWYQRAVALVRGPYLVDTDATWADYERVRLADKHMMALEELSRLYLKVNQLDKCLATCQAGINIDQCNEVLYLISMQAYAALGDRAAIARMYQICKSALHSELGLAPSSETDTMFRDLTA